MSRKVVAVPENDRELYVAVGVLQAEMADVKRIVWWILGLLGTGFMGVIVGMALFIVRGGAT